MTPALDLTAPRIITIRVGSHKYSYTFAPISSRAWMEYFDAIVSSSERKGDQVVEEFDTSRARLALVDAALESVEGYKTPDQLAITSVANWKQKLPLKHRLAVADQLVRVSAHDPENDEALMLGAETVVLSALWSADETGSMMEFANLRHHFSTPTADHFRRYQRDMSRSFIVGGSRGGKTIWKGAQKTLAAIYDELIEGVEGYDFGGGSNASSKAVIAASMDTYHKVVACGHLFRPVELDAVESAE